MNINFVKNWTLKRIIPHLLFWLFYVLFFGLFYGKYGHDYSLHLIENYIDLEKMRYGDWLMVNFSVNGKVETMKIAPMMLSLCGNSFKHGSSNDLINPFISINIEVNNKDLLF